MPKETLYLKLERNVELMQEEIRMKDLGRFACRDEKILNRVKVLLVARFDPKKDGGRKVISVMYLIKKLTKEFPDLEVQSIGETEVVAERVCTPKRKNGWVFLKICVVSGICFFGAAFTIMAFHNDISIIRVFDRIYTLVTGQESDSVTVLEISYSIGLALGIIVFFNHIGGRRITRDPTPIEVEMRVYEDQVNSALTETADREGKTLDAD